MNKQTYPKALKHLDHSTTYSQLSGPGGLELAEFLAGRMQVAEAGRMLDIGCNRGWQTCFLAKEFGLSLVGIDPWLDRITNRPMVEHLKENAELWGVGRRVLAMRLGVPDTPFAAGSFDYAYSTTALEMIRMLEGEAGYLNALREILRVLKPGGVFGLGEPMHLEVELPPDLAPFVSQPEFPWKECFRDISQTRAAVELAGFQVLEAGYAPDAARWWREFAEHDPFCQQKPEEDPKAIAVDNGRWLSFGYVIAQKPL